MFENDSNLHRQELAEKINKEVSHSIEKRLSDQNKLNSYSLQTDPLKGNFLAFALFCKNG